ncbi:MAG: ABC transporter permease [Bacteroidia bacterium]|nr:ABC transporter permease [Bacteroidia bacterium]
MSKKYSQLNAMLAISKASFRSILRSPSAVVFTLAFPLIFILVFGFISGGGINLWVALDSTSDTKNPIFDSIATMKGIHLVPGLSEEAIQRDLQKGKFDAVLKISRLPNDSTNGQGLPKYALEVTTTQVSREKGIIIRSMLEHYADKANLLAAGIHQPMLQLKTKEINVREYKTIDFILPGQLGFSLLSSGVFGTAFVFFNLRQTLVIKRFFATPIRKPFIVLGEALSRLVFSLTGAAFLILIGHFAFGFTLIHGFTTFVSMLLLSAVGLILFMGFGFVVSGIAKSESTIPPLANIVTLPQFLLSGTFFEISNFPDWLQPICRVLPLTYLNDAMRMVAYEGVGLSQLLLPLGVILAWGIFIYALAVRVFRWE